VVSHAIANGEHHLGAPLTVPRPSRPRSACSGMTTIANPSGAKQQRQWEGERNPYAGFCRKIAAVHPGAVRGWARTRAPARGAEGFTCAMCDGSWRRWRIPSGSARREACCRRGLPFSAPMSPSLIEDQLKRFRDELISQQQPTIHLPFNNCRHRPAAAACSRSPASSGSAPSTLLGRVYILASAPSCASRRPVSPHLTPQRQRLLRHLPGVIAQPD